MRYCKKKKIVRINVRRIVFTVFQLERCNITYEAATAITLLKLNKNNIYKSTDI